MACIILWPRQSLSKLVTLYITAGLTTGLLVTSDDSVHAVQPEDLVWKICSFEEWTHPVINAIVKEVIYFDYLDVPIAFTLSKKYRRNVRIQTCMRFYGTSWQRVDEVDFNMELLLNKSLHVVHWLCSCCPECWVCFKNWSPLRYTDSLFCAGVI